MEYDNFAKVWNNGIERNALIGPEKQSLVNIFVLALTDVYTSVTDAAQHDDNAAG